MSEIAVHPFAARFPMLDDDDLADLAADIAANGQREPITLNLDGALIDGRNRLEACRRAGVEPTWETRDIPDPVAFILSLNVRRRHLTKSQVAMAVAMAYPDPEKGGRGRKSVLGTEFEGLNANQLSRARLVLKHMLTVADHVLAGRRQLNDAYAEAVAIRDRKPSAEARPEQLKPAAPEPTKAAPARPAVVSRPTAKPEPEPDDDDDDWSFDPAAGPRLVEFRPMTATPTACSPR